MPKEFSQIVWNDPLEDDCRQLIRLAVREDLGRSHDWTTLALVDHTARARAAVVVRQPGVVAGLPAARAVLEEMAPAVHFQALVEDGSPVAPATAIAELSGPARNLLTCERIVLNFLGRLSGIATLTRQYVDAVAGSGAKIYDTRKTTPGWRRLEKYAVHCGGGQNHRVGLFDAVLIKDNHLAQGRSDAGADPFSPAEAIGRVRAFLAEARPADDNTAMVLEIEVDSLAQLAEVLPAGPDIVLLDNMTCDQLRQAVALRDGQAPQVELEASGGVNLQSVAAIAATGVNRISVGALTHSATSIDVGLDWR